MNRQARDHEVRVYFRADDYERVITWADVQDRSIANFIEHVVRRYIDLLEDQDAARCACDSSPSLRRSSEDIG